MAASAADWLKVRCTAPLCSGLGAIVAMHAAQPDLPSLGLCMECRMRMQLE